MSKLVQAFDGDVEHRYINVGDGEMHVAVAGPTGGEPVLLLHGFPQYWWSWRFQIPALAAAGYRVFAPDLRGYGDSFKPHDVAAYRMNHLLDDVSAIIREMSDKPVSVIAHDWGGNVGWHLTACRPNLVKKFAALNIPHPTVFQRSLRTWTQIKKSWYIFFFQLPELPENYITSADTLTKSMRGMSRRREHFDDVAMARYVAAFQKPDAARGALNYYRAALRWPEKRLPHIEAPVLHIWGEGDTALDIMNLDGTDKEVTNLRVERIAEASHWVQEDAPEKVNALLLDFLR